MNPIIRKRNLNILWGALIGCCLGLILCLLLPILVFWSPTLYFLADIVGNIVEPLTELGIRFVCGSSPNMGCASGIGTLIFFFIFPLIFSLFWSFLGAAVGAAFTRLESS
ncbi:MAG: hypothetical protein AAGA83_11400 [Cyanobacteria bacterium P01_F01_bin.116]